MHEPLSVQIDRVRTRIDDLDRRSHAGASRAPLMDEALEELHTALEELQVTAEELRVQNEELAASQAAVEAERWRYRELFELAPDAYLVTDPDGSIREANRAAGELLGTTPSSLSRKPLGVFVPEDGRRAFRARLNDLAAGGEPGAWELRLRPRGGEPVEVACTVAPARDQAGAVGGLRWTLRDVTERKRAEETARRLAAEEAARERITGIVESIADGFFALDAQRRFTYLNRSAESVLERGREELMGRPLEEAFPAAEHPALHEALERAARENAVVELEELHSPQAAWLELRVYPSLDGLTVYFRDVTERKHREEAERFLTEAGGILASTLDRRATMQSIARLAAGSLADYCIVNVEEGGEVRAPGIAHADPAREEILRGLLRRFPVEPDGPHPAMLALRTGEPQLLAEVGEELLEAISTGPEHLEMLRDLGLSSAMVVPMRARGRTLGAISFGRTGGKPPYGPADLEVARELARLAGLAADNARLYEESKQAARDRDEVLAVVSHDLRNPLHAVLLAATVLDEFGDPEARTPRDRQQIQVIRRSAEQMTSLIQDLVEVISLESKQASLQRARLEVEHLVGNVLDMFGPIAAAREIALEAEVPPGLPALDADRGRVLQVFSNVLGNAVKFTPDRGRVTVRAAAEEGRVRFSVADTGPGINPEHLPRLFDRFWQARQGEGKGLGLGLAIARGLVEAHGGRIWAESAPGQGTTFCFTLPVSPF